MAKRIRISIASDGTVRAETIGIKGSACASYLPLFEHLTSAQTVDSAFTAEYHQQSSAEQQSLSAMPNQEKNYER